MKLRLLSDIATGLVGGCLCGLVAADLIIGLRFEGAGILAGILRDPDGALRLIAVMAAFIAGLSALTERPGGSWLAGFAAALFGVQGLAMLGGRGEIWAWQDQAIVLSILTGLFLALVVTRPRAQSGVTG